MRVQTPLLRPPQHWVVFATETGLALTSPSSPAGESSEAGAESEDVRLASGTFSGLLHNLPSAPSSSPPVSWPPLPSAGASVSLSAAAVVGAAPPEPAVPAATAESPLPALSFPSSLESPCLTGARLWISLSLKGLRPSRSCSKNIWFLVSC